VDECKPLPLTPTVACPLRLVAEEGLCCCCRRWAWLTTRRLEARGEGEGDARGASRRRGAMAARAGAVSGGITSGVLLSRALFAMRSKEKKKMEWNTVRARRSEET